MSPVAARPVVDALASRLCPRCGADRANSFGAQLLCGRCGASWQADAVARPAGSRG